MDSRGGDQWRRPRSNGSWPSRQKTIGRSNRASVTHKELTHSPNSNQVRVSHEHSARAARVVVALTMLIIASVLLMEGRIVRLTGASVLGQGPSNLTFISPTPDNNSLVNSPWVIVNVSSAENLTVAALSWAGQNVTMERSGAVSWARVNGSGAIEYVVYALNGESVSSNSDSRFIRIGYVNWSVFPDQITAEDSRFDVDLWQYLSSVKSKADIGFSVSQDRTDRLVCGLTSSRFLNCTPVADAVGATSVLVTGDDATVSASVSFNVSLLAVNDPPRLSRQVPSRSLVAGDFWDVDAASFFTDPESDAMNFSINDTSGIQVNWTSSIFRFSPNTSTVGSFTFAFVANDSKNATVSNRFTITVGKNEPPSVVTRLTSLVLNSSKAYSIRFSQVFRDPERDDLVFSFENLSIARVVRRSDTLYIVPIENRTGTQNLRLSASDGVSTVWHDLPVTIVAAGSLVAASSSNQGGSIASTPGSQGLPVDPSDDLPSSVPDGAPGGAAPSVSDSAQSNVNQAAVKVQGPVLRRPLPSLMLEQGASDVTIDLSEYWDDPSGQGLEFLIEPKKGFVTKINEKRIAVISLSPSSGVVGNEVVKVIAKDSSGNIVSGNIPVTVAQRLVENQDGIDLGLQMVIGGLLILIVAMTYSRFLSWKEQGQSSQHALQNVPLPAIKEKRVTMKSGEQSAQNVWKQSNSAKSLLLDSVGDLLSGFSTVTRSDEPPELRADALRLKEALAVLRVLIASTEDVLIQSALEQEEEKLVKALKVMQGKTQLTKPEMRRLLLYVKEAAVCLVQIRGLIDETLIYQELEKEIARIEAISRNLETKLMYLLSEEDRP